MNHDLSIVTLLIGASWIVKAVVVILILMAFTSWVIIIKNMIRLKVQVNLNNEFDTEFRSNLTLADLYSNAMRHGKGDKGGKERIFERGMREFQELKGKGVTSVAALIDGSRCAMQVQLQTELEKIEAKLWLLGTVGSVSPYVGLFGTVWGIMHAFTGLGGLEQVTLAKVAPGIAEALIATAIALLTAIPAVIAYNRFASEIDRVAQHLEIAIEEFVNKLQYNLSAQPNSGAGRWLA
jgi:biopolymer transport protein TolQ